MMLANHFFIQHAFTPNTYSRTAMAKLSSLNPKIYLKANQVGEKHDDDNVASPHKLDPQRNGVWLLIVADIHSSSY